MNATSGLVVSGCAALAVVSVMIAASGQTRPGEPTKAQVWIQNRGIDEAVPVRIEDVGMKVPLPVTVLSLPPMTMVTTAIVQTRSVRQEWEYRSISVAPGQDPAALLTAAGLEGWETTGVQFATPNRVVVLLKRPR